MKKHLINAIWAALILSVIAMTAYALCLVALGDIEGLKVCIQALCVLAFMGLVGMGAEYDTKLKDSQCMTRTRL